MPVRYAPSSPSSALGHAAGAGLPGINGNSGARLKKWRARGSAQAWDF